MATRKNTRKSIRTTTAAGSDAWVEFDKFVAEHPGNEDLADGGGLALMAWIASLVKDAERAQQSQVDAAIGYLDPSTSA